MAGDEKRKRTSAGDQDLGSDARSVEQQPSSASSVRPPASSACIAAPAGRPAVSSARPTSSAGIIASVSRSAASSARLSTLTHTRVAAVRGNSSPRASSTPPPARTDRVSSLRPIRTAAHSTKPTYSAPAPSSAAYLAHTVLPKSPLTHSHQLWAVLPLS
jgi:hypothetical protein